MSKRRALSKRTRFRVFERDGFRCQYCGRATPEVVLEIDHVVPIASGGTDAIDNLITSCLPCNRGKSARPLATPLGMKERAKEIREREEQIAAYRSLVERQRRREEAEFQWLKSHFLYYFGWSDVWPTAAATIRGLMSRVDAFELQRCIEIAATRCDSIPIDDPVGQFRYWCGVVRGREERRRRGEEE